MRSPASSIVPARFATATFDTYEVRDSGRAVAAARALAEGRLRSLVLVGPTGIGKTHLAAAVVNGMCRDQVDLYEAAVVQATDRMPALPIFPEWLNVADAVVRLRLEMDEPRGERETTTRVRRLAQHRGLVVLDDLGREKSSDWTGETIYALVNARYEAGGLPTLVTSNLTAKALAESPYWPAISRLAEDGQLVEVAGSDVRLERAKMRAAS